MHYQLEDLTLDDIRNSSSNYLRSCLKEDISPELDDMINKELYVREYRQTLLLVAHSFPILSKQGLLLKYGNLIFMSTLHHEDLLLNIFEEVQEAFPYLDEDQQIEIANNRFQEVCQ